MSKLLIIDTYALIFRAFHAYPLLTTADGRPTNAIFGFMQMLLSTLEKQKPTHVLCSLESSTPTFRHVLATDYKANRKTPAEEIKIQIGNIKDIINILGIQTIQKDGYEADDVIGSYAVQHQADFDEIKILTGDRDLFQLLRENIRILMPGRFFSDLSEYDRQKFEEKYNISLDDFILYKSLIGDTSDNIKGIPGIGPKTAEKIVKDFHSIDSVLANLDQLPPKVADAITANQDLWKDYYTLSKIETNIELPIKPEDTKVSKLNIYKLRNIVEDYELRSLQSKVSKFIDAFEEEYGGFGLFEEEKTSDRKTALQYSITGEIEFEDTNKIFDIQSGKTAYILSALNPERIRLGNGTDFIEIEITEDREKSLKVLFNFIVNKQIKKFIGFDLKPFLKLLLESGVEQIENYECIDLKLAWHLIRHDTILQNIDELVKYLNTDSYAELVEITEKRLKEEKLTKLFDTEKDLQKVLAHMEYVGICCDKVYLNELQEKFHAKLEELTKQIYDLVGFEFKINSPKELSHVLYNVLHLPAGKKTKTGISTDDNSLSRLEGKHDIIPLIKAYRMYAKALSTYVIGYANSIQNDGKIHTTYNQAQVATGRLSSINPNMQNLPANEEIGSLFKKAFVVSNENKLFVSFDYSQIELRILAAETQDPEMLKAFANNEDIHTATARVVFQKDEVTKEERSFAKTINFGIVYGMESYGLAQALGIDQKTAKTFIDQYLEKFHNVKEYFDRITRELDEKGYVQTFMGRKRYFPTWKSATGMQRKSIFREAINMPIQGGDSEIMKLAMVKMFEYIRSRKIKADLILQIHDEVVFEIDCDEDLEKFKKDMMEIMATSHDIGIPLKVSSKEGKDLRFIG